MTLVLAALLVLLMGVTSRQSGGGLGAQYLPSKWTWLPEAAFSLPFGAAVFFSGAGGLMAVASVIWSYIWMQSATAPGLHWGNGEYNPDRTSTLKPFVDLLNSVTIKADPSTKQYCQLYMAVKGFLIGFPVGGVPLAILWPLGYEIGNYMKSDPAREFLAGTGAGISVLLYLWLVA